MPSLLHLPAELLLGIYHSISNIDDALHLARTCRQTHAIFNTPRNRIEIFRSIIKTAPHHKTDHQISYLQDLHTTLQDLSSENQSHHDLTLGFLRPSDAIFTHVDSLSLPNKHISDPFVWDTVTRWHGMKTLFYGLYCDASIHASYTSSTPPRALFKESNRYRDRLAAEGPLAPPGGGIAFAVDGGGGSDGDSGSGSGSDNAAQQEKNKKQKKKQGLWRAYERFYHALTAHWVAIETLSLAQVTSYASSAERNARFERVWTQWTDTGPSRPLEAKIDVLEVAEFVWGYLGRKIFQEKDVIAKWLGGTSALEEFYDEEEPVGSNWVYFVRSVTRCLRPPHVLELLVRVVWGEGRMAAVDRVEYLRRVGFFGEADGVVEREDDENNWSDPESLFTIAMLQEDVVGGLEAWAEAHGMDVDAEGRWEVYREKLWGREMRGRVLFREESGEEVFGRIMGTDLGESD